jgi:hypothetical protein
MPGSSEFKPLVALSELYILEDCPGISDATLGELRRILDHYLTGVLSFERASMIFIKKIHTDAPLQRISAIIHVPDVPIPRDFLPQDSTFQIRKGIMRSRKKSRPWTEYEDQRLLCAVHKYGLENWAAVSEFIGNERTRAQCSQRWFRGLDPRISRVLWTQAEEQQLMELVQKHGDHAWMKIAIELGSRSDSQCRYHYHHMTRMKNAGELQKTFPRISESQSAPIGLVETMPVRIESSASHGYLLEPPKPLLPPITEMMGTLTCQQGREADCQSRDGTAKLPWLMSFQRERAGRGQNEA